MARNLMQYVRTDKNGTKIYYDWTCPRCGGQGESDKWIATGKFCFECGGSGLRRRAKVVKEYTDEYWAKLDARRAAKAAKYAEEHADEIAQAAAEREQREATYILVKDVELTAEQKKEQAKVKRALVDGIMYLQETRGSLHYSRRMLEVMTLEKLSAVHEQAMH